LALKPFALRRTRLFLFLAAVLCLLKTAAQTNAYTQPPWQQLQSRLSAYSVIGLGEVGHGYESINAAKGTVAEFLRRQLGVGGVVFESSLTLSVVGYLQADSLDQRLKHSLYPFWNTASVKASLKGFYDDEQGKQKPLIVGCDVQEDCRYTRLSRYLLREGLVQANQDRLTAADFILSYYIGKDFSRKGNLAPAEYSHLVSSYELIAAELKGQPLPA
jgi:erythromycin esterase-like protein